MASISSTRIDDTQTGGTGKVIEASTEVDPDPSEVEIISTTVPTGKRWRIKYAEVCCRGFGRWQITANGVRIGGGITGPANGHDRTDLPDFLDVSSSQVVKVLYSYMHGPSSISIDAFIGVVES